MDEIYTPSNPSSAKEQALAAIEQLKARTKAFRFRKGDPANAAQQAGFNQARLYFQCRQIARMCSPDMMWGLVELACTSTDDRVRLAAQIAILDRAGVKPMEFDPNQQLSAYDNTSLDERKARLAELTLKANEMLAKLEARNAQQVANPGPRARARRATGRR
jgi:hypothetical protein